MTIATLRLHIDASGVIEELKAVCEVAAYEVDAGEGRGGVFMYRAHEKEMADTLAYQLNVEVEPLYRFKKTEADPNQPGLFEESQRP